MSNSTCDMIMPTLAQQQWHDMEVGMFFHFDIPIYKQGWNWRSWTDIPDPDLYQPSRLDTDQPCHHHGGYRLWREDPGVCGGGPRSCRHLAGDLFGTMRWAQEDPAVRNRGNTENQASRHKRSRHASCSPAGSLLCEVVEEVSRTTPSAAARPSVWRAHSSRGMLGCWDMSS